MKMEKYVYISILVLVFYTFDQGELSDAANINNFCDNKSNGNYADPDRCEGFITCSWNIAYKMDCPGILHYNSVKDICDWPYNLKPKCEAGKSVNPCTVKNGGCSQICTSTGKKVKCTCNDGFVIDDDEKTCNKDVIDGHWGEWSNYQLCDVTCGGGIQQRTRICDKPYPKSGGSPCVTTTGSEELIEVQARSCNDNACTITPPLSPPPPPPPCGKNKEYSYGEIVGGTEARRNRWIWQGGIYYDDVFICGGSLIHPNTFVTAAHCVTGKSKESMVIRMGDHERNKFEGTEQELKVDEIIVHEDWNRAKVANDIAIIKFQTNFKLNENVGTVCLPQANAPVPNDATCYITGWGKTDVDKNAVNLLQQAKIPVVPNDKCGDRNTDKKGKSMITENMLCAGFQGSDSQVSGCKGDSGGPYVCKAKNGNNWVLQGIVSWGSRKCNAGHRYTVFTRVSKYMDWINRPFFPEP